jgi:hypothetical protein
MRRTALLALALALLLAACAPPPPTNGAQQPVDPHTGVTQGGTGPVN